MLEAIEHPDEKAMAYAGYYQQVGESERALSIARTYYNHENPYFRASACVICFFSGFATGDKKGAAKALKDLDEIKFDDEYQFTGELFAYAMKNVIFAGEKEFAIDMEAISQLPEPIRVYINYFAAVHSILRGRDDEAIGIAKAALMMGAGKFPVQAIYLNIILGAAYTFKKDYEKAEAHYTAAWNFATPDGFIAPFVHQNVLLLGFDRRYIRDANPREAERIATIAKAYVPEWISLCNNAKGFSDAKLSVTELTVGILYKHNFTAKEIAEAMRISVATVRTHLMAIKFKTGMAKRGEIMKIDI